MNLKRITTVALAALATIGGVAGSAAPYANAYSTWWVGNASPGAHWHPNSGYTAGTDVRWTSAWYTNVGAKYCDDGSFTSVGSDYAVYQWRSLNSGRQAWPWFRNDSTSTTWYVTAARTDSSIGRPTC